jgi:hypothetical protein
MQYLISVIHDQAGLATRTRWLPSTCSMTGFPNIEAAEKVMHGMEDGLRAALPQVDAVLAEPSPSLAH